MSSLNENFSELIERIKMGRDFTHASFEPIYYLVFHPEQILEVKRQMPAWLAKLRNDGRNPHVFSVADEIKLLLEQAPLKKIWLEADAKNPFEFKKTNDALANYLSSGKLQQNLESKLQELSQENKDILLITDIEALHPYMRIGAIESQLQGKFKSPTIFFYPGIRTGKTRLKFLGFYPEDGNYRSVHVGG